MKRAGVIPIAEINDQVYLLLGKEPKHDLTVYTDFGGGCEKGEAAFACAQRELGEESRGLLQATTERISNTFVFGEKIIYFIVTTYDPNLPIIFANTVPKNAAEAELRDIEWVPLSGFFQIDKRYLAYSLADVQQRLQLSEKIELVPTDGGWLAVVKLDDRTLVGMGATKELATQDLERILM